MGVEESTWWHGQLYDCERSYVTHGIGTWCNFSHIQLTRLLGTPHHRIIRIKTWCTSWPCRWWFESFLSCVMALALSQEAELFQTSVLSSESYHIYTNDRVCSFSFVHFLKKQIWYCNIISKAHFFPTEQRTPSCNTSHSCRTLSPWGS